MTREERYNAIKVIKNFDLNNSKVNSLLFSAEEITNAFDKAVEALEQEPILDKIRAEVESLEEGITSYHNDRPWVFKDEVLDIIDKYRKESEK